MAAIQSLGTLAALQPSWSPGRIYSGVRLYDSYNYDYATIYRMQPNVRTCVDFLARNVAQLGLHSYRRVDDTDRVRLMPGDHGLPQVLSRPLPPDYKMTSYRLIEALMGDLGVYFNAFWLKLRQGNATGSPLSGLLRIPPVYMTIEGGLIPTKYTITVGGTPNELQPSEIVHFRGYNPENAISGLSPLETLRRVLAEEQAAGKYREEFWQNAARMRGIIERPAEAPEWSDPARERFMAEFAALYAGEETGGKTAVLEEGMKFTAGSFNPQESEYLGGRKLTREECARAYHIPLPMVGILEHATFCLPGYVPVFTAQGPRPISEVKTGDRVWSLGETGFYLKRVLRSGQTGTDPILRIKTQNRTLDCNYTHPILVRRLFKIPGIADEAANCRKRAGQSRWHYEDRHIYVPASEIRRGDVLITAFLLGDIGPDKQSLARMEFFGLYVGDGNLTRNGGKPSGIAISRGEQALYMDHYRRVMSEFTGRSGNRVALDEQPRQTRMCSVEAARLMISLGFSGTAHEKRVPGWIFESSFEARLAFLRGYLDADGSVDKKGRISYSSCNRELIEDVRHLCMSVGVPVNNIYNFRGKTTLPNGRVVDVCSWTITCADPGANRLIGSNDPRYLLRLAGGKPFGRKSNKYPFARGRRSFPPMGCAYSRVVSVEYLPEQPVYDLEVEDTHNFVAAGVVVHNSNITEQHKNLYQDSLGPWLVMIEQDIELQLLPEFPDSKDVYVEFNIMDKLAGSFEDQIKALQSAIGRPWMTPNEGRARLNMSSLGGDADELATPLNVIVGGRQTGSAASPRDSAPPGKAEVWAKARATRSPADSAFPELRARYAEKWTSVLTSFYKRQERTIVSRVPDTISAGKSVIGGSVWWDDERWNSELGADLLKLNRATTLAYAEAMAQKLGEEIEDWDMFETLMLPWLAEHSRIQAESINEHTKTALDEALMQPEALEAVKHVFVVALSAWVGREVVGAITSAANFGSMEAARASRRIQSKTWRVNSGNPRPSHAAMDGETVGIRDTFSNGLRWPGDPQGSADENAGCQCSVEFL